MNDARCGFCGTQFLAQRKTAAYCGATCRQRARRASVRESHPGQSSPPTSTASTLPPDDAGEDRERQLIRSLAEVIGGSGDYDTADSIVGRVKGTLTEANNRFIAVKTKQSNGNNSTMTISELRTEAQTDKAKLRDLDHRLHAVTRERDTAVGKLRDEIWMMALLLASKVHSYGHTAPSRVTTDALVSAFHDMISANLPGRITGRRKKTQTIFDDLLDKHSDGRYSDNILVQ